MKRGSLQAITDFYTQKGLQGEALRKALDEDTEYQELLRQRKTSLTKKFNIPEEDVEKYVLSVDEDYEILGGLYHLERYSLSDEDKKIVMFLKTQLEQDWRTPILELISKLTEKYKL